MPTPLVVFVLMYAPEEPTWSLISESWNNTIFFPSVAGEGLKEVEYRQIIDVIMDEEGPFSPERSGGVPNRALISMCFDHGYTRADVNRTLERSGGMVSWFGTSDMREVQKMIDEGNEEAALVFEAMALNTAKNIAKIAPTADGKIDFIILTGGLAYSERFVSAVKSHVEFLAPIIVAPGEKEMDALAGGTLRVLRGEEKARIFEG